MFRLLLALPLFVRMLALDPTPDPDPKTDPKTDPPKDPAPKADPLKPYEPKADPDRGFPLDTPVEQMTAEQQAAYWRAYARKHEQRSKEREDYDDLKAKAAKLDEIEAANATEAEKAAKAAREEGRTEGMRAAARAEFRAAAKGVLTDEARDALIEDLDMAKYLTDKGEVDVERIEKKVSAFAPAKGNGSGFPDLGQGRRDGGTKVSGKEQGREEARRRFGDRAGAAK